MEVEAGLPGFRVVHSLALRVCVALSDGRPYSDGSYLKPTPHFEQKLGLKAFPKYLLQAGHLQFLNEKIRAPTTATTKIGVNIEIGIVPRTKFVFSFTVAKRTTRMMSGTDTINCFRRLFAN